jgi:uncharacterized iron-regulated protein
MDRPLAAIRIRLFVSMIAFVAALGGCAGAGQRADARPPIWDLAASRFVTEGELVARLVGARFRLLGEMHDNPAHHRLRAGLIRQIAASGKHPAVVFEQFDLDRDAALVAAQRGDRVDAEALATAGALDRKGWDWPLHKPLLEAALAGGMPVRAGNAPRSGLMRIARAPAGTPIDAPWAARFAAATWTAAADAALRDEIVDGHCGKLPEPAIAPITRAQRMRDAAMAEAVVAAATADGTILIAGNGHIREGVAVPAYLPEAGSGGIVSVGFIEAEAEDWLDPAFPDAFRVVPPGFDYVWFTPAVHREDPCRGIPSAKAP